MWNPVNMKQSIFAMVVTAWALVAKTAAEAFPLPQTACCHYNQGNIYQQPHKQLFKNAQVRRRIEDDFVLF